MEHLKGLFRLDLLTFVLIILLSVLSIPYFSPGQVPIVWMPGFEHYQCWPNSGSLVWGHIAVQPQPVGCHTVGKKEWSKKKLENVMWEVLFEKRAPLH